MAAVGDNNNSGGSSTVYHGRPWIVPAITLYFDFVVSIYLFGFPMIMRSLATAAMAFFCLTYLISTGVVNKKGFVIVDLCVICWMASNLYNGNYRFVDMAESICYMAIGAGLIVGVKSSAEELSGQRFTWININGLLIVLALIIAVLRAGIGSNEALHGVSRNYVSVLGLIGVFLFAGLYERTPSPLLIVAIPYFVATVLATGRGGVLIGTFVIISALFVDIASSRMTRLGKRVLTFFSAAIIAAAMIVVIPKIEASIFPELAHRGLRTSRTDFWGDYLDQAFANPSNLLLGVDLTGVDIPIGDNNVHNSFLQLHASAGILPLVFLIVCSAHTMIKLIRNKEHKRAIVFLAILLRAFTDRLFFPLYVEPILYFYLFEGAVGLQRKSAGLGHYSASGDRPKRLDSQADAV